MRNDGQLDYGSRPCMTGTYQISPYLNFSLQDSGNTTYLRAVDKEWQFMALPALSFDIHQIHTSYWEE